MWSIDRSDESKHQEYAKHFSSDMLLDAFGQTLETDVRESIAKVLTLQQHLLNKLSREEDINQIFMDIDLEDSLKYREYALRFSRDQLLDFLSLTQKETKEYQNIQEILKIKQRMRKIESQKNVDISDINLEKILDKFYLLGLNKALEKIWCPNPELEFKRWLLHDISAILNGKKEKVINSSVFLVLWINSSNIPLLRSLRIELLHNLSRKRLWSSASFDDIPKQEERLKGKTIDSWHYAYKDSSKDKIGWKLVLYKEWDEYIPFDNSEVICISPMQSKGHQDIIEMYRNGERFVVVKETYKEFISDFFGGGGDCYFVHIRSDKTWNIYRALSV